MASRTIVGWVLGLAILLVIRLRYGVNGADIVFAYLLVLATTLRFACSDCCGCGTANSSVDREEENISIQEDADEEMELMKLMDTDRGLSETFEDEEPMTTEPEPAARPKRKGASRLVFLDNVKTFLTFLVVTFHVTCAFGGCGNIGWYLMVGKDSPPTFWRFANAFATLNQSFFMPLFFFISAYFVPSSFSKRGWEGFCASKRQRLLIPALGEFFLVSPGSTILANWFVGNDILYIPYTGVSWFLFWLLLFNWIYASVAAAEKGNALPSAVLSTVPEHRSFPGTPQRMLGGLTICALFLLPFINSLEGRLASMPISVGSFTCDFLMFYLGLEAKKQGWLETSLSSQMDLHPILFAALVVGEATGITILLPLVDQSFWAGISLVGIAGVFCLDMSLLILMVFQRYLNFETRATKFLARSAYAVYLVHPFVVTAATTIFITAHNRIFPDDPVLFGKGYNFAAPMGMGGGEHFAVGWTLVNLMSHVLVWPLAYGLTRLPYLKNIL